MARYEPCDPDFADRIAGSFARQSFMATIGASLRRVEPGRVEIVLPWRDDLTQQHGFFHGGVVGTLADNAGGYAAFTLFPADASVLTVEFKLNLLAPARGRRLLAVSKVARPGRTLTVCQSDVFGLEGRRRNYCATALVTLMCLPGKPDTPEMADGQVPVVA
ncbi:MAG: PaaI family thioesterase [Alphaproteobacteria bacterium]|jgi:uncharacterized protein (TIGR00369 family)|nr:PaaI family thioesterase [Alphaproteobacteria bacterium]MDP6813841.1 PaaI family thioesterase [Alphaproteobacteria bacterium]